jgi:hypothetical protein
MDAEHNSQQTQGARSLSRIATLLSPHDVGKGHEWPPHWSTSEPDIVGGAW